MGTTVGVNNRLAVARLHRVNVIGAPTAYGHHGQQHQLHQLPGSKAANLSNYRDVQAGFPRADHVGDSGYIRLSRSNPEDIRRESGNHVLASEREPRRMTSKLSSSGKVQSLLVI
jgi:hypothetical protein